MPVDVGVSRGAFLETCPGDEAKGAVAEGYGRRRPRKTLDYLKVTDDCSLGQYRKYAFFALCGRQAEFEHTRVDSVATVTRDADSEQHFPSAKTERERQCQKVS